VPVRVVRPMGEWGAIGSILPNRGAAAARLGSAGLRAGGRHGPQAGGSSSRITRPWGQFRVVNGGGRQHDAAMKRRHFLKTSMAASALTGLSAAPFSAAAAGVASVGDRECYELRAYRLKAGAKLDLLDAYWQNAAIPELNRLGVKSVGVFFEAAPKDGPALWVVIPYPSLKLAVEVAAGLNADPQVLKGGAKYLQVGKDSPAYERIDSWLLLAFAGMPKLELSVFSPQRQPRIFELRTYASYSEVKALKKIEMFNSGEISTMKEVGLAPVFYGQALMGRDLPHLTYMLSAEDEKEHKKHWDGFRNHPVWVNLKNDPQYADTVMDPIISRMLTPTMYSQI